MSFCRWDADCNLYIFENMESQYECCACIANGGNTWECGTREEMIKHVREHIRLGHKVPDWVIPGLEEGR
jgi:hypothetical protein